VGSQVAREIISQGGPAIQTTVSRVVTCQYHENCGAKSGLLQIVDACPRNLKGNVVM
jgi:hypothetical protein